MPESPLPMLVILQAGALLGLSVWFGLDALRRKDGTLGWMAGAATATALAAILEQTGTGWGMRLAGLPSAVGYVLLFHACCRAYPVHLPRWLPLALASALVPGVVVQGWGPLLPAYVQWFWVMGQVLVAGLTLWGLWALFRLRDVGECAASWVLPLVWSACVLLLAHALARPYIGALLGLEHSSLLLFLLALASCHLKDLGRHEHLRAEHLEAEVEAWRSLLGGPSWRTGEAAEAMVKTFGRGWAALGEVLADQEGRPYRICRKTFLDGAEVGWAEPMMREHRETIEPFLGGWTVGLGMDDGPGYDTLHGWLEAWGALVIPIGTAPPREAPYPDLFLWAREPSILSVWRELDLGRRRCRWVQIGGTDLEGPHAQVERDASEAEVREVLRSLVLPEQRAGAGRP